VAGAMAKHSHHATATTGSRIEADLM
jgi:hypothetical protein